MELNFVRISPGLLPHASGLPLREGRAFDERDRDGQPERIIVNETMARRFWPDGGPSAGSLRFSPEHPFSVEVIGVVPDVHYRMVREEPTPTFYVPLAQWPSERGRAARAHRGRSVVANRRAQACGRCRRRRGAGDARAHLSIRSSATSPTNGCRWRSD